MVWFGEELPGPALDWAAQVAQDCDVMLVVGTSGVVQPAAMLPGWARQKGALVIEVNPENTPLTGTAQVFLQGASGTILPQLIDRVRAARASSSGIT